MSGCNHPEPRVLREYCRSCGDYVSTLPDEQQPVSPITINTLQLEVARLAKERDSARLACPACAALHKLHVGDKSPSETSGRSGTIYP